MSFWSSPPIHRTQSDEWHSLYACARSARIQNLTTLCVETVVVFPTYHTVAIFTANQGHHTSDDQPAVPFRIGTLSGLMIISVCVLMAIVRRVRKVAKKERPLASPCLSVFPQRKTRLQMDEFSWNLKYEIWGFFENMWRKLKFD